MKTYEQKLSELRLASAQLAADREKLSREIDAKIAVARCEICAGANAPMKTTIPKGFRKLRVGEMPRATDRIEQWEGGFKRLGRKWVCDMPVQRGEVMIRRRSLPNT
jgi:hypothetical protein